MSGIFIAILILVIFGISVFIVPRLASEMSGWDDIEKKYPVRDLDEFRPVKFFSGSARFEVPWFTYILNRYAEQVPLRENRVGLCFGPPRGLVRSRPALVPWKKLKLSKRWEPFCLVITVSFSKNYSMELSERVFLKLADQASGHWIAGKKFADKIRRGKT